MNEATAAADKVDRRAIGKALLMARILGVPLKKLADYMGYSTEGIPNDQ
jgi:hypothetical protein